MAEDLEAKYIAWANQLEKNIRELAMQRRQFFWILGGAIVLSGIGFFFGPWFGVGTFATGLMLCVAGVYMTTTRRIEFERELERTREEVARLRGEAPPVKRQTF